MVVFVFLTGDIVDRVTSLRTRRTVRAAAGCLRPEAASTLVRHTSVHQITTSIATSMTQQPQQPAPTGSRLRYDRRPPTSYAGTRPSSFWLHPTTNYLRRTTRTPWIETGQRSLELTRSPRSIYERNNVYSRFRVKKWVDGVGLTGWLWSWFKPQSAPVYQQDRFAGTHCAIPGSDGQVESIWLHADMRLPVSVLSGLNVQQL